MDGSSARASMSSGAPGGRAPPPKPYDVADGATATAPELLEEYRAAHASSKAYAASARPMLADNRNIAHFSLPNKEACHPIVARSASGCRVTDADGNELIDLAAGFGAVMYGHNPPFVRDAVLRMLREGSCGLGFEHAVTARNEAALCRLTGMERCAFCTTGTEATSLACRLSRRHTGRRRVVTFEGSYHGHYDGFLGAPADAVAPDACVPVSPGIPAAYTRDLTVLPYDDDASLAHIAAHADEIACVFCEPVQNRNPACVPRRFLRELRALTAARGIVLVFDEVVSGFRVAPGGVQQTLGIRADLAAYGKALGGGYQVGCVAGSSLIMVGADDGAVCAEDGAAAADDAALSAARPLVPIGSAGGTWAEHPLVMAATGAVLAHIEASGEAMFERLNGEADHLAGALNGWWRAQGLALRVDHYCSMIRFQVPAAISVAFYQSLLGHGVYCWESRTCFLTTAHRREDVDAIAEAVRRTTRQLQGLGVALPTLEAAGGAAGVSYR